MEAIEHVFKEKTYKNATVPEFNRKAPFNIVAKRIWCRNVL